jgi:hypothetical protein
MTGTRLKVSCTTLADRLVGMPGAEVRWFRVAKSWVKFIMPVRAVVLLQYSARVHCAAAKGTWSGRGKTVARLVDAREVLKGDRRQSSSTRRSQSYCVTYCWKSTNQN